MRLLILVLLASCKFNPNPAIDAGNGDDDASLNDGNRDAPILDGQFIADGAICVGHLFPICVQAVPPDVNFAAGFNTDVGPCDQILHGPTGPEVCVVVAHNLTVTGTVTATGHRPLVLAAFDNLKINTNVELSVSSSIGFRGAAGYDALNNGGMVGGINDPGCALANIDGQDATTGGGGGAGGSHRGKGGIGGNANATHSAPASVITAWSFLRGGCPGGKGGKSAAGLGGFGGAGGGVVLLVAMNKIQLDANAGVAASGAGGLGGGNIAGGGGGGSGGFIGIDGGTLMIAVDARIIANGGGGAGGSTAAVVGSPGDDGKDVDAIAQGGAGAPANGGNGSLDTVLDGSAGQSGAVTQGGGGGGGGAGVIMSFGTMPTVGIYSPRPVLAQ